MRGSDHGDHAPALDIVATELKLHTRGAERGGHASERITQAVGRLGPTHRAAHGVADHGVKPCMKFCDRPHKALADELRQRLEQREVSWSANSRLSADSAYVRAILSIAVTVVTAVTRLRKPVAESAHVSESEARIVMIAIHFCASPGDDGDGGDDDFMIFSDDLTDTVRLPPCWRWNSSSMPADRK